MEAKSQSLNLVTVPGKKDDPSYSVVRGHVPNDLYKKFKLFCLDRGVDNSEGLELLLSEYFESQEKPQPQPVVEAEAKPDQPRRGTRQTRKKQKEEI